MDYEKEYKEALERARAGKLMDEVFPELKESEDEKIRKAIILALRGNGQATAVLKNNGVYWEDAISWLEKQKEQKPAEWSEEDDEKIERLRSIVNDCAFRNDALDVNGDYCEGDYGELDAWLKSLRPQSRLAVTREVLTILSDIIEESKGARKAVLKGLYDKLKTLKP